MDQGMQFRARAESIADRDEGTLGVNVSFIYCDSMPAIPAVERPAPAKSPACDSMPAIPAVERPAPAKSPALSIGGCVLVLVAVLFFLSCTSSAAKAVLGATSTETIKTGEVRMRSESSPVLFDKDEKVIWKAP
jgi:hypothetical protein